MSTNHIPAPGERPEDHPFAKLFPMMDAAATAELAENIKKNGLREPLLLEGGKLLDGRNRYAACLIAKVDPQWEFFDPRRHGISPLEYVVSRNLKRRHLTASQRAVVAAEYLQHFEQEAKQRQQASGKQHAENVAPKPEAKKPAAKKAEPKPAADQGVIPGTMVRSFSGGAPEPKRTPPPKAEPKAPGAKPKAKPAPDLDKPQAVEPKAGKATDQAGAAVGVSGRMVREAKALGKQAPEKLEEVKAGTKSLGQAKREAGLQDPEVQQALARIRQVCGRSLADAIQEGTRLKTPKEILAYAAESDEVMLRIRSLIESDWTVAKALKFKFQGITRGHKVGDLLDRAAANAGNFTLDIDGWQVEVRKAVAK